MQYIYNTEKRTLINAEDIMKILKSSKGDTKIQELENLGKIKNNFEKFIEKNGVENNIIFNTQTLNFIKKKKNKFK
jgi:hypothetical protein